MLKGNKVTLRLFKDENEVIDDLANLNNLDERAITDHTEIYSEISRLKQFREDGSWSKDSGVMAITIEDDKIIGSIGFYTTSEFEKCIGYRIPEEKYRGKGYMSEALTLFTSYLFTTIPLITRIALRIAENNTPSRKLAEKCGFTQEGILRKAYFYRGKMHNFVLYSILREEVI
jgi:RimJ/RimL family protein N-acetyltransferase